MSTPDPTSSLFIKFAKINRKDKPEIKVNGYLRGGWNGREATLSVPFHFRIKRLFCVFEKLKKPKAQQ